MTTLVPFDPLEAEPVLWASFHAVRRALAAEDAPERAVPEDQAVEKRMKLDRDPQWSSRWWLAFDDGTPAGRLQVATRCSEDAGRYAGRVFVWGGVAPQLRRRAIGTIMARHLHALMLGENHDAAAFPVSWLDAGAPFFAFLGARLAYEEVDNRLSLDDVDWPAATGLVEAIPRALRWEEHGGRVPLDRLRTLAPQMNRLLAHVPRENLDLPSPLFEVASYEAMYRRMDATAGAHLLMMLFDGEQLVASCETTVDAVNPALAMQLFTGVAPAWRGRGLAGAVKARTLQLLRAREPAVGAVHTKNAASNGPMLRVNRRLGFRVHRRSGVYEVSRDRLASRLNP